MSQTTEYKCDKCGKTIINETGCYSRNYMISKYSARIQLWGIDEPRSTGGQRIDLCPECYERFINFLEGGAE